MRTAQAASPLSAQQVGLSLMAFVVVYFLVFGAGIYYMLKLMHAGPAAGPERGEEGQAPREGRRSLPALV
jgi:cytochrome d ubiquinol oxidase subunit I